MKSRKPGELHMDSKYDDPPREIPVELKMMEALPPQPGGLPDAVLSDICRHHNSRVSQVFKDATTLVETDFDAFKIGATIATLVWHNFARLAGELLGTDWKGMDERTKMRACLDVMLALSTTYQPGEAPYLTTVRRFVDLSLKVRYYGSAAAKEDKAAYAQYVAALNKAVGNAAKR